MRTSPLILLAPIFFGGLLAACGSANANHPQNPDPNDETHRGNTAEVVEGGPLFVTHCAKCHGATGHGGDAAPAVVGDDALPLSPGPKSHMRTGQFATAKDVFEFMKATMPKDKPGSLSDNQYYAILAFDLKANKVDLHGTKVDPTTVGLIRLPGR